MKLLVALVATLSFSTSPVSAQVLPVRLPEPDGERGSTARPVKVYVLAGQSNMVGMGMVSGARCRYTGVYLTPDAAAPRGPVYIGGWRRVRSLGIYPAATGGKRGEATAFIYSGVHDLDTDFSDMAPSVSKPVSLGTADSWLPAVRSPHTLVVRGFIEVPETGLYSVNSGFETSSHNVTWVGGEEVYRKRRGGPVVRRPIKLAAGERHRVEIVYGPSGGSAAFWLSQEQLEGKGDLEALMKRTTAFQHLVDDAGRWTVREDVYYQDARINFKGSSLSPSSNGKTFGPELGFGHVVGAWHDEQVLLIKTAMGNRSLGFDFRPPSSGRRDPENKWESLEYKSMVEGVRKVLADLSKYLPGYEGQGYEVAGFAWWQGHKDGFDAEHIADYEDNLVNLIKDVRRDLGSPKMPVVVATVGFGGHRMQDKYVKIVEAQLAVGDPERHPDLAGTVACVDTRGYWRTGDDSPKEEGHHYNRNAETYLLVGDALGRAMVGLVGGRAEPLGGFFRPPPADEAVAESVPVDPDAARKALAPMIRDGMVPSYLAEEKTRAALVAASEGERPTRVSQFLRGPMFGLTELYRAAGVADYDWRPFGPDLADAEWEYFTFDPPESMPVEKGNRYRKVTLPEGMQDWFTRGFDAAEAGWRRGRAPFGQLGGELAPLSESCRSSFCRCGEKPRTLWDKEVLLVRKTVRLPELKEGHRYRVVVGGSAHVNAGEGFALYVNGKMLAESKAGVGRRQGGQPRGGNIYRDVRGEFDGGGEVTIAAMSFLRYNHPRHGVRPPRGHLSVMIEEAKIPPLN